MKNLEAQIEELREISNRTFYLSSEITEAYTNSAELIRRAQSNGEKLIAQKALEIILALQVLLKATLMRIDYYEEQEKEANNKQ